jgi:hypothetical protein
MKISDLIADSHNANKGNKRGHKVVAHSLKEYGAGRSILVDKAGRVIAGNKTASEAAGAGIEDVIVVESDGTKLVVVQRTDLDLNDPKARALAIADNRASELGLEWDVAMLKEFDPADLQPFFDAAELRDLGVTEPEFKPGSESDQGKLDEKKKFTCPECGHEFAPST